MLSSFSTRPIRDQPVFGYIPFAGIIFILKLYVRDLESIYIGKTVEEAKSNIKKYDSMGFRQFL
jgi:hypothetical protein